MHTIGHDDDANRTNTAVRLCMTHAILVSMTPQQIAVFKLLCALQIEDAGVYSLLPGVMDALFALARRPWWDAGVADIPGEPDPRRPDPPAKPLIVANADPEQSADTAFWARHMAMHMAKTHPIAVSMTSAQDRMFDTLCDLQVADAGPASLLPNVVAELLALARQPWWARDADDLADEDNTESGRSA